jgi:hypothetical protein
MCYSTRLKDGKPIHCRYRPRDADGLQQAIGEAALADVGRPKIDSPDPRLGKPPVRQRLDVIIDDDRCDRTGAQVDLRGVPENQLTDPRLRKPAFRQRRFLFWNPIGTDSSFDLRRLAAAADAPG